MSNDDPKKPTDNMKAANELIHKLVVEERNYDKQQSMHMAKTGKRDVVVMMGVYVRNSIGGKLVLGDDESSGFERFSDRDMYKYKTFDTLQVEYPASTLPGVKDFIGKGLLSGMSVIVKWLASLGCIR